MFALRTTILTFDSLGSPHPKAVNILTAYLCMEAQDKLQMANTSKAVGKTASVSRDSLLRRPLYSKFRV